jgi:radical SAM protein (TIGR01212 family)
VQLSDYVNTFGQHMLRCHGQRVHKVTLNAEFTCPNRDGNKGRGGCTFCNNASFNPNARTPPAIAQQLAAGRQVIGKRTGARQYIAYFQAYTNTYADIATLSALYEQALAEPDVIGLAVGTRPDCVPDAVLDLLCGYQQRGFDVWLELGLQSSFDHTLKQVNRGHGFAEYVTAVRSARARGLKVCTHLIAGLPGENATHCQVTLERVIALGVDGLKLHPLHVVKGTMLANQWRQGAYRPLQLDEYINIAADLIEATPPQVVFHRLTATASANILLAPEWCAKKWLVLNRLTNELHRRRQFRIESMLAHPATAPPVASRPQPVSLSSWATEKPIGIAR